MSQTYFGSGYLRMGSSGDEVKQWQEFLKGNGYNVGNVDGIFGNQTQIATMAYQAANGLTVDGIAGKDTLSKAGFSGTMGPSTPTATSPTFNNTNYNDTTEGKAAWGAKTSADKAVNEYGDFAYSKDGTYQDVMDRILNREKFSYDLDGDALYQQYKDKYIKQGKMAMEDTMGQAAAMTGGYGNSYAQTAGQQAYNAQLDNLNDIVPELYQMAYDRYNQEGQDLYNQYSLLSADKDSEHGMWTDGYNRLTGERTYASDSYYNAADLYNANIDRANSLTQQEIQNGLNERQVKLAEDELELKKNSSVGSNTGSNTDGNNGNNKPVEESASGFTGKTRESALSYMKSKGVPNSTASNMMTAIEWSRRKASYQRSGQGGEEVKNYSSYQEYLADFVEYAVETFGN